MLILSFWTILFFVLPHCLYTQARKWDVQVCLNEERHDLIYIRLNEIRLNNLAKRENCFSAQCELINETKPTSVVIFSQYSPYKIIVQNHKLQEAYGAVHLARSYNDLNKWVHWRIEVKRNKRYDNYEYSFKVEHFFETNVVFKPNSRTSYKSFFLPMKMNTKPRINLLTRGEFWLDTDIKLKNMETSSIYSCIYINKEFTQTSYHECPLVNNTVWKIELTSRTRLIKNTTEINVFLEVPDDKTNSLYNLTLKKLAVYPTFAVFTNIRAKTISNASVYFNDTNEAFEIFKIVLTKVVTGEEYGCSNVDKTIPDKYSCRLRQSKNWQLRIISSEEHEQSFFVEIIQATFSSFSEHLIWYNNCEHEYSCVNYFILKTYEDNEISSLKLKFLNKSFIINKLSLRNDHTVLDFKEIEESKIENPLMIEFTRKTEVEVHLNETVRDMKIAIGFLLVIILFSIIINVILGIRYKMLRNSLSKGYPSTLQDTGKHTTCIAMQDAKSARVTKPRTELGSQWQNQEDTYENINLMSGTSAGVCDSDIYEELK